MDISDRRARGVYRTSLTKLCSKLDYILAQSPVNVEDMHEVFSLIEKKRESIEALDNKIFQAMLVAEVSEVDLTKELDECDGYTSKVLKAKYKITKEIADKDSESSTSTQKKRKFKLPHIKFVCFDGEIKNWLNFWGQFSKVHNDSSIPNEDKIQYLILATEPESRARELVQSFPAVGENYGKMIDCLKNRFGRDDLLVEVYVRELLGLVLKNAIEANKVALSSLYDKLECHMRALETLGVTSDKCASMLLPLVESCLPEELLRVWQRTSATLLSPGDTVKTSKEKLDHLMIFIRAEVEGEQKVSLAMSGFGSLGYASPTLSKNNSVVATQPSTSTITPSAANLLTTPTKQENAGCVFCGRQHKPVNCAKAQKMMLEEKKQILRKNQCCFACFKPKHTAKYCKNKPTCIVCQRRHSVIMCESLPLPSNNKSNGSIRAGKQNVGQGSQTDDVLSNLSSCPQVQLQTLLVKVRGNNIERTARAIIDTGSQRSYVLKSTLEEMRYSPLRFEKIQHSLFGGSSTGEINHGVFKVYLSSVDNSYKCNFEVLDQTVICGRIAPVQKGPWLEELQLEGICIQDVKERPVEILIGADIAGKLVTGGKHRLSSGLVAIETKLGWTLMGRVPEGGSSEKSSAMIVTSMLSVETNISDLWSLDVLGIRDPLEHKSKEELHHAAYNHFLNTVRVNHEGRYEVQLPWLEDHPPLPENYELALKCLNATVKKLSSSNIYDEYEQVFKEWLEEGVIEEVPKEELNKTCHYMPHRAVVKESSLTTKIRPVFNASAREGNQPSLNHCLDMGLNFIELIPSILIRFREEKIGVVADIRRAFLQISLAPSDRDFLRFLWLDKDGNIIVYRHCRVVFGVTCSPFLLAAVIKYHLEKIREQCTNGCSPYTVSIIQKLLDSFYVDNTVTSVRSLQELNQFRDESVAVMNENKFDLRSWEYSGQEIKVDESPVTHVLGMLWDKKEDTLEINLVGIRNLELKVVSKRTILSVAHRVFDPIGVSCSVSLIPKIMLQTLWSTKMGWDQEVDKIIKTKFLKWLDDLPHLSEVKIPRWLPGANLKEGWTLHVFCDASQDAYAAAAFLRSEASDGVRVQLVQARSRVSPLGKGKKRVSIPRLELLAACIGARLYHTIVQNLTFVRGKATFWSDSSTTLAWILRDEHVWNTFVTNRVNEIRNLTNEKSWRYVPGHYNPADLPSRGCLASKLVRLKWWEGPKWLKDPPNLWPIATAEFDEEKINEEKKKTIVSMTVSADDKDWYYRGVSDFKKLTVRIAYMLRFIRHCKMRKIKRYPYKSITAEEVKESEKQIISLLQQEAFEGVEDEKFKGLCPFYDEIGLIRLKTKISNREDIKDFCYPMVLPNINHPVVNLIVMNYHQNMCHAGVQIMLASIREKYWLLGGRRALRKILNACQVCKRHTAKPIEVVSPPLPSDRVRDAKIFEVVGVDFAGPLHLKSADGNYSTKAWVCLFTCGVYRAIHLELVTSLSTDRFLLALRRFIGRRGRPSVVYSDNGTNFIGAANALNSIDWNVLQRFSSVQNHLEN